jgi:hypothetical protein
VGAMFSRCARGGLKRIFCGDPVKKTPQFVEKNELRRFGSALVQILISGLQLPNFIFFAESPVFDCKICPVKIKLLPFLRIKT